VQPGEHAELVGCPIVPSWEENKGGEQKARCVLWHGAPLAERGQTEGRMIFVCEKEKKKQMGGLRPSKGFWPFRVVTSSPLLLNRVFLLPCALSW